MKNNFMIEKLQTIVPPNKNDDGGQGWATLSTHKSVQRSEYEPGLGDFDNKSVSSMSKVGFAGASDVTDNSSVSALNSKMGYTRASMSPTADQYTGEMCDPFYDEMVVDGDTGFVERHNYLDRI